MRLAWFSPFPPVRTGIAGRSAELVDALAARGHIIDRYPEERAHDFVWRRRLAPYDLAVYQFGNSSHHDYEWAYALNYPGLAVLHDTHLHHARAAFLLREKRIDDYRAEFAWSHPGLSPDLAEAAVAGLDSRLYYEWPMVRSLVDTSRLVGVHGEGARTELLDTLTGARDQVVAIRLGEGQAVTVAREARARAAVRARYRIADEAVLFGCFGGLTPEKRLPQVLTAFRATLDLAPDARLLLAGAPAAHYDSAAGIAALGLTDCVTVTGYLEREDELTDHLAACDVTLNLRWPTARETSGPWLRALAAGRATIITDLVHLADVPSLDPRTWTANVEVGGAPRRSPPICVAIDILDEDHSLRLAMRRLAADAALRRQLGGAAHEWWAREHSLEAMAGDYERVMREAAARPPRRASALPAHLRNPGDRQLRALLDPLGIEINL